MYSTCLFCNKSLGANEAVEHFPVGRRLAFDAARGRLWAVCRGCGRWNLSPLDDRWEAIEECERLYRGTRLRASTDEIGLARVADGTELVRIGAPPRGEFAAWRYGDQFGKRRQRMVLRVAGAAAVGGVIVGTHGFGLFAAGAIPGGSFLWQVPNIVNATRKRRMVVARGVDASGEAYVMRGKHLGKARLSEASDGLRLHFEHDRGPATVEGAEALRVSGLVLARLNAKGAGKADVQKAVVQIERAGGPDALLASAAHVGPPPAEQPRRGSRWQGGPNGRGAPGRLQGSSPITRLALEMAVHEENERRALEGELGALAADWKGAEEIAQISDDMFLPETVTAKLDALKAEETRRGEPRRLLGPDGRPVE